ncbi:MAG: PEPxxWA-CTERM sorting domain-containing protein [Azoarcus sp.]|jgi:hypothetical protein|nr:PEPxxWA-CTERM sorting domain-containing protein [Azoarcus sp.]
MFRKSLILPCLVVFSSLVVNPVLAAPTTDIRDTSEADQWMAKFLGESSDWEGERSYTDGVLSLTGYVQTQEIEHPWAAGLPWISLKPDATEPGGYFSYVTMIDGTSFTVADPETSFSGLSISFAADDLLIAFVINGAIYDGFTSQEHSTVGFYENLFIPFGGNISWNAAGNNTVEIVVHNYDLGYHNPTGLSATIQAVPEPETWAMLLAGLGIVGVVTRRRRTEAAL